MANDDVDDIFKDFEHKVTGKEPDHSEKVTGKWHHHPEKKETEHHKNMGTPEKGLSEEEHLKRKYERAEHVLKHKYKKEKEALKKKREEELPGHAEHSGHPANRHSTNLERVAYIAVIVVLVAFITIDLSFYHGKNVSVETDQTITAAAVKTEDTTEEITAEVLEEVVEEPVEEEKVLSGKITFTIDKVYTEVPDEDNDFGYISKVVFTIDNGKDKVLKPVVDVYVYDSELHESWETKSRGQYIGIAIKPGDKQTGSISVYPKTFANLDLEKNLRLVLNNTEDGSITAVNDKITIS